MKIDFSQSAWADYTYWQNQNKKTLKRINQPIEDISRNGNDGMVNLSYEKVICLVVGLAVLMKQIVWFID